VEILVTVRKCKDGQVVEISHLVVGLASPAVIAVSSA
jgi:hypothetical protein